jgi:hypothetical protein
MLGSIRMKKIAFVLAAAGLMSLAACHKPADTAVNNEADMTAMDNSANAMDTMATNASDMSAENAATPENVTSNM